MHTNISNHNKIKNYKVYKSSSRRIYNTITYISKTTTSTSYLYSLLYITQPIVDKLILLYIDHTLRASLVLPGILAL